MNTTSLHIQIEPTVKRQAKETADQLGLSLSAVVKALLKQLIRTKHLSVGMAEEIPNARTIQELKQSEEDIKAGRVISFKTPDDALAHVSFFIDNKKETSPSATY